MKPGTAKKKRRPELKVIIRAGVYVQPDILVHYVSVAWHVIRREADRRNLRLKNATLRIYPGLDWRGTAWRHKAECEVETGPLHTDPREGYYYKYKDMPRFTYANWIERFIGFTAHELNHLVTRIKPGKQCEIECEVMKIKAINEFRRRNGYRPLEREDW